MINLRRVFIFILAVIFSTSCGKSTEVPPTKIEPLPEVGPIVKVMSYNIHIGNPPSKPASFRDLEAIAQVINVQKPDLVALSEVDMFTKRSGTTVDQAKELGRLTGMFYYFTKAMNYDGGEYGDAVLSRFPIIKSERYELPVTSSSFEPRSLALITVEKEGKQFYFGSTHLDHTADDANRNLQARKLVDIIKTLSKPLILAGDWNAKPDSEPISILKTVLTPTCATNCPNTFSAVNPNRTLDYVMFTPEANFKLKNLRVVNETYASDHLPLIAELELK